MSKVQKNEQVVIDEWPETVEPEVSITEVPLMAGSKVKINPGVKQLIGGQGVNCLLEGWDLYAKSVGDNGVVTLSYTPDGATVGAILKNNVTAIVAPEVSDGRDDSTFKNIDVRIMGVPSRMENILKLKERLKLDDEHIFIDENMEGCVPNAKRAWSLPTKKKFVLVLQDDVDLCNDFPLYCEKIVKIHPDDIISLFPAQFRSTTNVNRINAIYKMPSPYVLANTLFGQGIIMKREYVEPCIAAWRSDINGDDTNIFVWAKEQGINIITTLPATIQHIGDVSVYDNSRKIGTTDFFERDVSKYNWDSKYVTPWTNLIK